MASVAEVAPLATLNKTATEEPFGQAEATGLDSRQIEARYGAERAKRLREDVDKQYVEAANTAKFTHFNDDPWVNEANVKDVKDQFPSGRVKVLVLGAGFAGILYAVRMIEAGLDPKDLRMVDTTGGFGGTWYRHRYPGLMCDVESYIYLPLLEETGYVPKHRYSYGQEIREYAEYVAGKYNITDSAVFQTKATQLKWIDADSEWQVDLTQTRQNGQKQNITIRSQFVVSTPGVFNNPKLLNLPGVEDYAGPTMHTSSWNYDLTGGSESDPSMTKLRDKRVAIIGTGSTGVQVIPQVAKWAKHLYVVQRTPPTVDERGQRETDVDWFKKEVAPHRGWQRDRCRRFHQQFNPDVQPPISSVTDGWASLPTMAAFIGYDQVPKSVEEVPAYLEKIRTVDRPRAQRIRDRVTHTVKDKATAEKLVPWYPSWCKRPCFHDDYLPTFNRDNVTLIDTDGKGLSGFTADSIISGSDTYPVDMVIFATGFRGLHGSPADRSNLTVIGRSGASMSDKWHSHGPGTLHGVVDKDFPNLFLSGPSQASLSLNWLFFQDQMARHAAYIYGQVRDKADDKPVSVAPTGEAAEDWRRQIQATALGSAGMLGCTPSFFNMEGKLDTLSPEAKAAMSSWGRWGLGVESYLGKLEEWRTEGSMQGLEISVQG